MKTATPGNFYVNLKENREIVMEDLYIRQTKFTPEIKFDREKKTFSVTGASLPEDTYKFFEPVMEWVDSYQERIDSMVKKEYHQNFTVVFSLTYFNSGSLRALVELLKRFKKLGEKLDLNIFWYYDEEDVQMMESGEEIGEAAGIKLNLVKLK
jgi:hypothetical protein